MVQLDSGPPVWPETIERILDIYLGEMPESFQFEAKTYTPRTFADQLMINPDDFIGVSSYTHQPFHKNFVLQVPDNWATTNISICR